MRNLDYQFLPFSKKQRSHSQSNPRSYGPDGICTQKGSGPTRKCDFLAQLGVQSCPGHHSDAVKLPLYFLVLRTKARIGKPAGDCLTLAKKFIHSYFLIKDYRGTTVEAKKRKRKLRKEEEDTEDEEQNPLGIDDDEEEAWQDEDDYESGDY